MIWYPVVLFIIKIQSKKKKKTMMIAQGAVIAGAASH